jgi:hypothetical protein
MLGLIITGDGPIADRVRFGATLDSDSDVASAVVTGDNNSGLGVYAVRDLALIVAKNCGDVC